MRNAALNTLAAEQIAMQVKMKLLDALPAIIEASVKPLEKIDGIKIVQVDGLNRGEREGQPPTLIVELVAAAVILPNRRWRRRWPIALSSRFLMRCSVKSA